jgi:hypothetical protein
MSIPRSNLTSNNDSHLKCFHQTIIMYKTNLFLIELFHLFTFKKFSEHPIAVYAFFNDAAVFHLNRIDQLILHLISEYNHKKAYNQINQRPNKSFGKKVKHFLSHMSSNLKYLLSCQINSHLS